MSLCGHRIVKTGQFTSSLTHQKVMQLSVGFLLYAPVPKHDSQQNKCQNSGSLFHRGLEVCETEDIFTQEETLAVLLQHLRALQVVKLMIKADKGSGSAGECQPYMMKVRRNEKLVGRCCAASNRRNTTEAATRLARGECMGVVMSLLPKCTPLWAFIFEMEWQFNGGKSAQMVLQELRAASFRSTDRRRRKREIYKDKDAVMRSGCQFEVLDQSLVI